MMKGHERVATVVAAVVLALVAPAASGAVVFVNIGTGTPGSTVGPAVVTPFDVAQQAAIANLTNVTTIPGSPVLGSLTSSIPLEKRTVPGSWATWSHAYTGPVFYSNGAATCALNLPPGATAFRFFAEPNVGSPTIEAVTNSGTTSGPIVVAGASGATGYGFYTTAGETIATVTITQVGAPSGFAIGEFAIGGGTSAAAVPGLGPWGLGLSAISILAAGLLALHGRGVAG